MRCCCAHACDWLITPQIICCSQLVTEMLPIIQMMARYDHVMDTHLLKLSFLKENMALGYFWLTSPQIRHICALHACITTTGCIWPRLAMSDHRWATHVRSMVKHGHNLVITGHSRRAKVSPEWTNSNHVQPGHLKTMTKLVQLWLTMHGGCKQGCMCRSTNPYSKYAI